MPVAHWKRPEGDVGPKQIHAPKEASLKGWWNACRKVFPDLPRWIDMHSVQGHANAESIHFEWFRNDLFIARRRNMR